MHIYICTRISMYVCNVSVSTVYGHCTVCGNFGPKCECLWLFASSNIRIIFSAFKVGKSFIGFCHVHFSCYVQFKTRDCQVSPQIFRIFFFCSYSSSSSPFTVLVYKVHDLISEFYFPAIFRTFLVASGMLQNVMLPF